MNAQHEPTLRASFVKLWDLLSSRDRARLGGLLLLQITVALLEIAGIGLVPVFVAAVADPGRLLAHPIAGEWFRALGVVSTQGILVYGGAALVAVFTLKTAITFFALIVQNRILLDLRVGLGIRLFDSYMQAPYLFHLAINPAELMRNTNAEVVKAVSAFVEPLLSMIAQVVLGIAVMGLLLSVQPVVTLLGVTLFGVASVLFLRFLRRRAQTYGEQAQDHRGLQIKAVNEGLGGIKEVQVMGRQNFFVRRYAKSTDRLAAATLHQKVTGQISAPILEWVAVIGMMVMVAILMAFGSQTEDIVPLIALFAVALFRLKQAFSSVVATINTLRYEHFAINPVYDHLRHLEGVAAREPNDTPLPQWSRIEFDGVSFTYPGGAAPAVNEVSLRIPRGAAVAFVGATGAGKSTLADLLLGLLLPGEGMIRVDNTPILDHLPQWQSRLGYIPQSLYLVDDTLRRNIALGIEEDKINDDRIAEVVRMAQLEEVIEAMPDGVNTRVGDRGVRVSGGQRQRICIARALYHDPDVLILDEATSALDNETESRIVADLEAHRGQRTLIVIAHRLSTVRQCDRLFLLENGRIADSGTYEELMQSCKRFQQLATA